MSNDNEPTNVVPFKSKKIEIDREIVANVFVNEGLVGLQVKDGLAFLSPADALELCMVLVAAMQVAIQNKPKE